MKPRILPALLAATLLAGTAFAQQAPRPQTDGEKKALAFLLTQQDKDGAWVPQVGPAITAMGVKALAQSAAGNPAADPGVY